jgi:hypothetical protein
MFKGRKVRLDHNWADALAYAEAPCDAWGGGADRTSHRARDASFHALDNMPAALAAMREGWTPGRERIAEFAAASVAGVRQERVPTYRLDVAGERPFIPAAIAGDPRAMFRRRPEAPRSRPVVRVVASIAARWDMKPENLARRGAAILAWLDALESSGWTTSLDIVWRTTTGGGSKDAGLDYRVEVKPAGERFDVDRLSFALVCPDMLRRIGFAVLEGCSDLADLKHGYGTPTDLDAADLDGAVYLGKITDNAPWSTVEKALASVRAAIAASRPDVLA